MIVTYLTKKKINISFPDTSIYYFSKKNNNGGLSLNSYMDSLFNSKLYKVRFVFNTSYQEGVLESIPSREFSVEKKEIKLQNENKVINFIERFTKEHPNY